MAYRRYWLSESNFIDNEVRIDGEAFHHIFVVCRMGQGDRFEVIHPQGKAYLVKVIQVKRKEAMASIEEERQIAPLLRPYLHLVLCVSKFNKMDDIVEKAVELGTHTIHPAISAFSFVRQVRDLSEARLGRWKKIALSATQQCGRGDLMAIEAVTPLEEILETFNRRTDAVGLFAYEGASEVGLRSALKQLVAKNAETFWLFIGSEGGFSEDEVQKFRQAGLEPVSLGTQVLRVETACVAALSAIKYEFGMMG